MSYSTFFRPKFEMTSIATRTPPAESDTGTILVNRLEWLNTELLLMVIKNLPNQPSSLAALRLVSRKLNSIAAPLKYTHIYQLSDKLLDLSNQVEPDSFELKILNNYRCYTRHVRILRRLGTRRVCWNKVLHFLCSLKRFEFLSLRSRDEDFPSADFFEALCSKCRGFQLYLFDFSATSLESKDTRSVHSLPILNLVSLWVQTSNLVSHWWSKRIPTWPPEVDPTYLKDTILHATRLRFLKLDLSALEVSFWFKGDERLPPFERLILQSYCWVHSTQEALNHWDWSRLTHLHLENVSAYDFFRSVPPDKLAQLQSLFTDEHCEK